MRLGLCCKFLEEPIRFRQATATALLRLSREQALRRLSQICLDNADALHSALEFCAGNGIGAFRINSQIMPLRTHPDAGYRTGELPDAREIRRRFRSCGRFAREHSIRTLFHPDQFVVLSSVDRELTRRSVGELRYQAEVAEWVGADVINIHGGGAYGDKRSALSRVESAVLRLPEAVKRRLTFENDDRVYTPADLLPLCRRTGVPLIYDVHHHRCLPDGLSVAEATRQALRTWDREPVLHISSPKEGRRGSRPGSHHDFIAARDFPPEWLGLNVTLEVEAKAKEKAVLRLARHLGLSGSGFARVPSGLPPGRRPESGGSCRSR